MATSRDVFTTEIYVNNEQADDAIAKMTKRMADLNAEYEKLKTKNGELHKDTLKKKKQIDSLQKSIDGVRKGVDNYAEAIKNLDGRSIENLTKLKRQLNSEIKKLKPGTEEYIRLTKDYEKVSKRLLSLEKGYKAVSVEQQGFLKRLNGVSSALMLIGNGARTAIAAVRRVAEAYKTISDFEQANANLSTILGVNVKQMEALTENAKALGRSTEYTASQVTQLQTELAKLGFNQGEIMDMSKSVLEFATAVGADLPSAAAMAGVALRSFDLSTKDSEDAMATMAVACSKSALSFEYLQNAFSTIAPVAKTYGLSLKDTVALLGKLADAGFDASSAATATRNILLNLADANGKLAKSLGGSVNTFDDIFQGLVKLRESGVGLKETLELTDKRSVSAFNTFLDGAESAMKLRSELEDVDGELARISEERLNTVEGSIKLMQSAWEGFILSMSNSTGTIKKVIDILTEGITTVQNLLDPKSAVSPEMQNGMTDNLTDVYMRMLDPDKFEEYVSEQLAEYDKRIKKQSKKTKAWGAASFINPLFAGKWGNSKGQLTFMEGERDAFEAAAKSISENVTLSFQQQLQMIDNVYQRKVAQYQSDMSLSQNEADKLIAEAKAEYDASRKSIIKEETERINAQKAEEEKAAEAEKEAKIKAAKEAAEEKKKLSDKEQQQNQKKYNEEARIVDARLNYEQKALKVQLMKQEITQEEYDNKIIEKKSEAIAEKLALAKKYHQDETKLSAEGMDLEIEKIQRDSNAKKKKYDEELSLLKQSQKDEETELKKQLTKNEITQDEYDSKMLAAKVNYLKQSVDLAGKYGQDETQIMQAYLDAQVEAEILALQQMEKLKKEAKDVKDSLRTPEEVRGDDMAKELARLEELHDAKLLSEKEYEEAVKRLREKYSDEDLKAKLGNIESYIHAVESVMHGASNFVSTMQDADLAKAQANYNRQVAYAGDNAAQREKIEIEYEEKKLEIQKKYADAQMAIGIAEALANGAIGVTRAFRDLPAYAAVPMAVIIAATTAAQIASIIAQRNAIKSQNVSVATSSYGDFSTETVGGDVGSRVVTGYARGGYTEDHTTLTTVGERGTEWIAPHWMVKQNPITFANLESYRRAGSHGRSGSVARGFADGGYTPGAEGGENGFSAQLAATLSANTDASNRLASLIEKGLHAYVLLSEIQQAQDRQNRFNDKTSR